jgi:hypothetical protein
MTGSLEVWILFQNPMIEICQPHQALNTQHPSLGHLIKHKRQFIPITLQIVVISLFLRPGPHISTLSL